MNVFQRQNSEDLMGPHTSPWGCFTVMVTQTGSSTHNLLFPPAGQSLFSTSDLFLPPLGWCRLLPRAHKGILSCRFPRIDEEYQAFARSYGTLRNPSAFVKDSESSRGLASAAICQNYRRNKGAMSVLGCFFAGRVRGKDVG